MSVPLALVLVLVIVAIAAVAYVYSGRACTRDAPCPGIKDPHLDPSYPPRRLCEWGWLDRRCTARCLPPYVWDKATQACRLVAAPCRSAGGAPGACNYDKDCNAPNGVCQKDSAGDCVCVCAPGHSGVHCETAGVPYNSYACMGPNKVPPAQKDKNGLCVCPPGHWASGTDEHGRYVQCLKCGGAWGPLGADYACTRQWVDQGGATLNDCYYDQPTNADCAAEFGAQVDTAHSGPAGQPGSMQQSGGCNVSNCRCPKDGAGQWGCMFSGWVAPGTQFPQCTSVPTERACSSYACKNS